jgi:uncharacterized protein with PIN domain
VRLSRCRRCDTSIVRISDRWLALEIYGGWLGEGVARSALPDADDEVRYCAARTGFNRCHLADPDAEGELAIVGDRDDPARCPYCGADLDDTSQSCPDCAAELIFMKPVPTSQSD